jgi:DNA repair exonuclease SbcCD ATPase subunit
MPISGPVLHQQLIQAYQEAQHELETARGEIAAAGAELGQLSEVKSDSLLDLARHYLPELTQAAVERTWSDAKSWISGILAKKVAHVARLDGELQRLGQDRRSAETQLGEVTTELDAATERQQTLSQAVSDTLAADPEFTQLANRAGEAEASLKRAEANLQEIEQDSLRKLPSYENSALFMYLRKREFATAGYRHRGLTRSIDQWLSRYIGYRDARQGYEFLKSTPQHMREVIADDRQSLNVVLDELERRRDAVAAEMGLPEVIASVEKSTGLRGDLVNRLEQIELQVQSLQAERSQIDDTRGPYYQEAIERFREVLAKCDGRTLAQRARETSELDDDLIVARLNGLQIEIDQVSDQVGKRQQKVAHLTAHLQSVGTLINRFRAAGFDSSRATFNSSVDVASELRAVRDGGLDYESVWQRLRRSHRWANTTMDQITQVATHPMTQVLINAMAHAAAGALQAQARDAGERRASRQSRTAPRAPSFPSPPTSVGGGFGGSYGGGKSSPGGGFKTRGGF